MVEQIEIKPVVQETMLLQSDPKRLVVLATLYPEVKYSLSEVQRIIKAMLEDISSSTLSHIGTELSARGLVDRQKRVEYRLTDFGRASVEAFQEYRAMLLPEILATRLTIEGHPQGIPPSVQEQIAHLPESYHPEAALLRVMRIHGQRNQMAILQSLSSAPEHSLSFRELHRSTGQVLDEEIPGSTLSNNITEMKRELLTERVSSGFQILITSLGIKSLESFYLYQARLGQFVANRAQQKLQQDFGGLQLNF